MNDLFLEAVGFLAGAIITSAAMPRVLDILRDPGAARGESYARNAMLVLGNLIWVVYGVAGSRWGELILPAPEKARLAPEEAGHAPGAALRVVLFPSVEFGYLALQAVKAYAHRFPGRVQLAGVVTDDLVNRTARMGLKKRVWKHMAHDEIVAIETAVVESAVADGVPAYTGEIKIDGFRALLDSWRPDAIVSCVFGQVIDGGIIERPAYGIDNFHPTDLAHGFGAGPTPAEDLAARGMTSTVWTIHQVIEALDAGPVVVYDKLAEPVGCLAACLVDALWRRFAAGRRGSLDRLDVEAALPAAVRANGRAHPRGPARHGPAGLRPRVSRSVFGRRRDMTAWLHGR
jgi:folate-dependent phosphoribosylglycinamide formyltransferase PurN